MKRTIFILLSLALLAGCGEDAADQKAVEDHRLSGAEPALSGDPLTFTADNTYVPLALPVPRGNEYRSDLALLPQDDTFAGLTTEFGGAVLTMPILDESDARFDPDGARMSPQRYQPKKRFGDLADEIEEHVTDNGHTPWSKYVLVFDLFRVSETWLVRWDGKLITMIEEPGEYGLYRQDMRDEIIEAMIDGIDEVSEDNTVTHVVVGSEMERLLLSPSGTRQWPDNPAEFANFVSFFAEAKAAIKEAHPDVQVSAGLNYDRLISHVAARYTETGDRATVSWSERRYAWENVAEKLYAEADFLALASEPDPEEFEANADNLPDGHYAMLAEYQGDRPIVWYSINWPVNSDVEKSLQRAYLERFKVLNAGLDIELVSYRRLQDLDDSSCNSVVKALNGPITDCTAGMFRISGAPGVTYDVLGARE